jgi:hypothetical protein
LRLAGKEDSFRRLLSGAAMKLGMGIVFALVLSGGTAATETYRLVHAVQNSERIIAKGLSKSECESRKKEYVLATGVLSGGSVTCLPESIFRN